MSDDDNNLSPEQYRARIDEALANLDTYEKPVMPECEADYEVIEAGRRMLNRLNYAAAYGSPKQKQASRLANEYSALVSRYNARFELPAGEDRSLARYLLWSRYYSDLPTHVAWLEARDRGLLRKERRVDRPGYAFSVVGLRAKVGDNSFTVDEKGRHHRVYCRVVGRQAIYVVHPVAFEGDDLEAFAATVPDLGDTYYTTDVHASKNSVRPIALNEKERARVFKLLAGSPHRECPRIALDPPVAPAPVVIAEPAPMPVNGDLFEGLAA